MNLLILIFFYEITGKIYFVEEFVDDRWEKRWIQSRNRNDYGKWNWTTGKWYDHPQKDKGIKTIQNSHFYSISSSFNKFSNKEKTLILQYTIKHEQGLDCGGGYLKLFPSTVNLTDLSKDTKYNLMFGPDICATSKRLQLILHYKGKNYKVNKYLRAQDDDLTHLYSLLLYPNNSFEVRVDWQRQVNGMIEDHFDMLPVKWIPNRSIEKPKSWDGRELIDDPNDKRPIDWDDTPIIKDPNAQKPDDWNEKEDGPWEAEEIRNPKYKGKWKPKKIKNPNFHGIWVAPKKLNPLYKEDNFLYAFEDIGAVGIDIWQVKAGSIFDNILITDSFEEAREHASNNFIRLRKVELELRDANSKADREKIIERQRELREIEKKRQEMREKRLEEELLGETWYQEEMGHLIEEYDIEEEEEEGKGQLIGNSSHKLSLEEFILKIYPSTQRLIKKEDPFTCRKPRLEVNLKDYHRFQKTCPKTREKPKYELIEKENVIIKESKRRKTIRNYMKKLKEARKRLENIDELFLL